MVELPIIEEMLKLLRKLLYFAAFAGLVAGCAHSGIVPAPALAKSPGGLNENEIEACEDMDCTYFIAPCSLKEHSPLYTAPGSTKKNVYLSLKEESYLDKLETLSSRGYCQLPPRAMPTDLYSKDTCIYVFVKKGKC